MDWFSNPEALARAADYFLHEAYDRALMELRATATAGWEPQARGSADALSIMCLSAMEMDTEAESQFQEMLHFGAADKRYLLAAGIACSEMDEYEWAERTLKRLCEMHPGEAVPRYNLAFALRRAGRHKEALLGYQKAIELDPEFAGAHQQLAHCLKELGQWKEALPVLLRYLKLKPDDAQEWVTLAILYSDLGNFPEAYDAYLHAEELMPDNPNLFYNWALTAKRCDDVDQLRACRDCLRELDADDWRTHVVEGLILALDGRVRDGWQACLRAYDKAGETDPSDTLDPQMHVAQHALMYAKREELREEADAFVEVLIADDCLDEPVLDEMRLLRGQKSPRALDYLVLVGGAVDDAAVREMMEADEDFRPPYRYFTAYRVLANDPDDACHFALEFERKRGGRELKVSEVETRVEAREAYVGVRWCDGIRHLYPVNALDDEDDEYEEEA